MSSDSGSDSGSSSSYSSYDEAGISTPTSAYESIGTTGYDEAGTTTPSYSFDSIGTTGYGDSGTYDEAALSQPSTITGPTDPGVAGTYVDGQFVPSQDTITSFTQNLKAEYASNPLSFLLSPLGTCKSSWSNSCC
jgi:hypothetical protein